MALPVVERIAQQIVSRLELVTLANDYSFDAVVERPKKYGGFTPVDRHVVLLQGARSEDEENSVDGGVRLLCYWQEFAVVVFAIESDKSSSPIEQLINLRESDCQRAITTPETVGDDWTHFDGLAQSAMFGPPSDMPWPDFSGLAMKLRVQYRHPENDPTTVA